jgi:hypothetical protein
VDTIELDQATLTEQANAFMVGQPLADTPLGPASVQEISVQLEEGRALVTGRVRAGFMTLPASLTATAVVEGERPIVRVEQLVVGGFAVPDAARQLVETRIQAEADRMLAQIGARVAAVIIRPGTLALTGTLG